ncbi:MAG: hypothetical protein EAZ97_04725 [Bacteroidetes bacterium]|nr:MAG: hypothetical protein EAZ97_04725 [Bacteroidota bacterium]
MENRKLWENILDFSFEKPNEEYGFSVRLASENAWTEYFAKNAILEYKKFMYLATISKEMVSPSEIVDIVWHQHLIFTQSYADLGKILGKKIEHIPSTHNSSEKEKFILAKNRTKRLYEANFGKQPELFWNYYSELDSIPLNKSKRKISEINTLFLVAFLGLIMPFLYAIKPILEHIENPFFLVFYVPTFVALIIFIELFATKKYRNFIEKIYTNDIFYHLNPFELIMFKENKLEQVIHSLTNSLIKQQKIKVMESQKLKLFDANPTGNLRKDLIIKQFKEKESMYYAELMKAVIAKPLFQQYKDSVEKLRKLIFESKEYQKIVLVGMALLTLFLSVGLCRLYLGISHDRPVLFLEVTLIIFSIISFFYLQRLKKGLFIETFIEHYQQEITERKEKNLEWDYAFLGAAILVGNFEPLTKYTDRNNGDGGSSGSSCGSSGGDGGGCGGGCGGCGGGGD